jgi:hypothetical protein
MGLSRSVIPNPFDSKLASRGCLLETGLAFLGAMAQSLCTTVPRDRHGPVPITGQEARTGRPGVEPNC